MEERDIKTVCMRGKNDSGHSYKLTSSIIENEDGRKYIFFEVVVLIKDKKDISDYMVSGFEVIRSGITDHMVRKNWIIKEETLMDSLYALGLL